MVVEWEEMECVDATFKLSVIVHADYRQIHLENGEVGRFAVGMIYTV
jgi:hypothetical protein